MPGKKVVRYKKKKYRKKKKAYRIKYLGLIVPDKVKVILPITKRTGFTTGAFNTYIYRANSINQPTFSGSVTDRPLGYNEWEGFYQQYQVTNLRVSAQLINHSAGDGTSSYLCLGPSGSSSGFANIDTAIEQKYAKYGVVSPNDGGKPICNTNININMRKFRFQSGALTSNIAAFGANPTTAAYMIVSIGTVDGATVMNCSLKVKLYYTCVFSTPKDLAAS